MLKLPNKNLDKGIEDSGNEIASSTITRVAHAQFSREKGQNPNEIGRRRSWVDLDIAQSRASVSEETKTSLSMGGNESKSHSRRKETTSTGFLGRGRHIKVS